MAERDRKRTLLPSITIGVLTLLVLALAGVLRWLDTVITTAYLTTTEQLVTAYDTTTEAWARHWNNAAARAELTRVQAENQRLRLALYLARGVAAENASLRALTEFHYLNPVTTVSASRVVYESMRSGMQVAWINLPENLLELIAQDDDLDHLSPNLVAAMSARGLAGRVIHRRGSFGQLLPLGAVGSALDVRVGQIRALGEGAGDWDRLELHFIPRGSGLQVGDIVTSGGGDGIYPAGLPVGTVESVSTPDGEIYDRVTVQLYQSGKNLSHLYLLHGVAYRD